MSKGRIPLLVMLLSLVLMACSCGHHIDRMLTCGLIHAGNQEALDACVAYTHVVCPMNPEDEDVWGRYYFHVCLHDFFPEVFDEPVMPGGVPQQPNQPPLPDAVSVTPTPDGAGESSGGNDGPGNLTGNPSNNPQGGNNNLANPATCAPFRLTSPRDGLPNGVATFFWDPLPGATGYQVVASADRSAVYSVGAGVTSVSGDVSQNAIGGQFTVNIAVLALVNGEVACSTGITLPRAAPDIAAPPSGGGEPTARPTDPTPG